MKYQIGDIVKGEVTGIEKYGVFLHLDDNYNGLIHISEISDNYVKNVYDYVTLNEVIYARVLEVDDDNNHLKLSIKDINYKEINDNEIIKETRLGFYPLKEKMPEWIDEKREYFSQK